MSVTRYQQGGQSPQNMQEQITALVQAAMSGDQKAQQQIEQVMQAAKNGDKQAVQVAQMIQQIAQAMQKQARTHAIGGRLAYIHKLRTGVNLDEEVTYHKKGGKVEKKVVKKEDKMNKKETKPSSTKKTFFS